MIAKQGKIQLVVFDWAGTTIDFGSCAPATAFAKVFAAHGVQVSDEEARRPMGLNKREHLISMLSTDGISKRWHESKGAPWTDADVSLMYDQFVPYQLEAIEQSSQLVPHLLDVIGILQADEIKVGNTTGYFRAAAELVSQAASRQGFVPDANVCADDVPKGRPAPWMIYQVMQKLNVFPPQSVVKIGDTVADIEAGLNAGCWTIGICDSSSIMGLSLDDYCQLDPATKANKLDTTASVFQNAGSHFTIASIEDLPRVISQINQRLGDGERP
ncbi:phosphonoacetaldehyde hydrolase [Blastopirellula marina]|uniref:phosphonoacetaldehyde hydrolase n=1 Tax=Blastopirellula marina TaxID=124 RepID=A0A2S8F0X9_9BACT|nr:MULTISPECIES: phosphonoacetaldehyde hydrolase [Pirellulaceae]PQO25793.1 phosphonoacetaldehyde hydrolase [Blastopirellula marina]RCS43476.1 phosphonoacetaldehyde hydrolase [Bremerella cremea]